jgi:3-hydroxy acid dehydrogenase / malonic semialdehyde reductase
MKQTILITGATSGIGESSAKRFASAGYRLILTGRRNDRLEALSAELKKEYNTEVLTLCFDVRDKDAVEKNLGNLPDNWNDIDILINNAGLAVGLGHVDEGVIDDWERMIDTNVKGLLYVTRAISPGMVKRNKGHIINIGSIAGKQLYENGAVYCASKHAVDALSRGMRIDFLKHGIKVTNIAPGLVETEFSLVRFKGDEKRAKAPYTGITPLNGDDIASVIFFAATLPAHVNLNDIVITPTAQADAIYYDRK